MNNGYSIIIRLVSSVIFILLIFSFFAIVARAEATLSFTKTATETSFNASGVTLHYTLVATNTSTGGETLTNVSITDPKLGTLSCTPVQPATLAVGETLTCTGTYTTTQGDVDAGLVTNTATATADGITPVIQNWIVNAEQNPELTVFKSSDTGSFNSVGNVISYSFDVSNSGNVTLDGPFTVIDDKATDENCPVTSTLSPGVSIICTASYTITQADLNAGSVTNTAYATGSFGGNPVTSINAGKTVNAIQTQQLTLAKAALPITYDSVGDSIAYTYTLTNSGNVALSSPFTVSDNKATVTCPPTASLDPQAFITCTATYLIAQADLNAGSVTNTAQGQAFFDGTPIPSNEDSETVTASQSPTISLTKTSTETSYKAVGNILHYTLVSTNSGNVTLTNVNITDAKLGNLSCNPPGQGGTLAPGASLSCTGNYTIQQADLDAKSVTNTANSTGNLGASTVQSNPATHTVFGATFTVSRTSGLLTTEGGTTDTFTIKLDKKPAADVVITFTSSDPGEGVVVPPASITFKPGEWTTTQAMTVTVQGVNDNLADGPQPYTIITTNISSGSDYSGVNPPDVSVTNGDNDTAGLTVAPLSGLITTEGKVSAKIQVKLNTQPTANVALNFTSSDLSEGNVEPASLIIKPADWNLVNEVTVTGVDDKVPDGNQNYLINISPTSSDGNYNNKPASVSATNRDAPTIAFTSPVPTGQIYEINNLVPFLLKVVKDGTEPITRVRFYRWDAVKKVHVVIGEVQVSPYQLFYDPALLVNKLNPGFNQVFAVAYNSANAASDNIHIWVYKQGNTRIVFLPIAIQNR